MTRPITITEFLLKQTEAQMYDYPNNGNDDLEKPTPEFYEAIKRALKQGKPGQD